MHYQQLKHIEYHVKLQKGVLLIEVIQALHRYKRERKATGGDGCTLDQVVQMSAIKANIQNSCVPGPFATFYTAKDATNGPENDLD